MKESNVVYRHLELTSGYCRLKRATRMYPMFLGLGVSAPKLFGYRRLYPKPLRETVRLRIRTDYRLYQICAFYYVRYVILRGFSETCSVDHRSLTRDTYWLFGILRDYMTLLDSLVDTTGCTLDEAINEPSSMVLYDILRSLVRSSFGKNESQIYSHIQSAISVFESNKSQYRCFYDLDESTMVRVLETDTGSFASLLGDLFSTVLNLSDEGRGLLRAESLSFSMAFTIADDFLDLRTDVSEYSLNSFLFYFRAHGYDESLIVRRIRSGDRLDINFLNDVFPDAVEATLGLFSMYHTQIRNWRLRSLVEVTLQAGIYDYPWRMPFLFPR